MFERLKKIAERNDELTALLSDAEVIKNMDLWRTYAKEQASIADIVEKYKEYVKTEQEIADCKAMINDGDAELKAMAHEELSALTDAQDKLTEELKIMLLPKDPNDEKNVVMEIRAGAGGEEAGLFGTELMRMYHMYADSHRWKVEDIETNMTELGGVKEVVFLISGKGAYSRLKYESGVHRVQRVPETESQGRVHTSTVTVAVLPESEEVEVEINEKDLKIDTYRSGGAGGQHVNKTESAIRITHLPTGLVVTCEDERSQIKNRDKAMRVLKSRLYDYYQSQADKEYAENRKTQVGTGDRSERIRTYNYPQGRVTDHRIGYTIYALENFLNGDMDEMISALALADQTAKLAKVGE